MARIIVTTDRTGLGGSQLQPESSPVLLDERVEEVHLSTDHAASQLLERLSWAVRDAERAEGHAAVR
jgi:hypothetical protein